MSHFCQSLDAWLIEGFDVKSSNHWHLQLITYTLFVLLFHVIRSFCRIYFDFVVYHFGPFINLVVIVVLGSLIFKRKKKILKKFKTLSNAFIIIKKKKKTNFINLLRIENLDER